MKWLHKVMKFYQVMMFYWSSYFNNKIKYSLISRVRKVTKLKLADSTSLWGFFFRLVLSDRNEEESHPNTPIHFKDLPPRA